jgi:hypothetical protein
MDDLVKRLLPTTLFLQWCRNFQVSQLEERSQALLHRAVRFVMATSTDLCLQWRLCWEMETSFKRRPPRTRIFFESAGSLGTLGITTQLEIQVIDCDGLVEVTYTPVTPHAEALPFFDEVGEDIDFVDSVMFSSRHGVVVEGRLIKKHTIGLPIGGFVKAKDPWFFINLHRKIRCDPSSGGHQCLTCYWTQHSRKYRQDSTTFVELVPIEYFLFRYDRGVFWMAAYGWALNL